MHCNRSKRLSTRISSGEFRGERLLSLSHGTAETAINLDSEEECKKKTKMTKK